MHQRFSPDLFKTNILFGLLYLSFKTPVVFFMGGVPAVLQLGGADAASIGLFQLTGLPVVLNFLFSPIIDRFVFKKNHYKKWIAAVGLIYVITLFYLGKLSLSDNFYTAFIVILFATLLSTLIDIPLNALSIKVYLKNDRVAASGYKTSAYFLSGVLGSGALLLLFNHFGWTWTFNIVSAVVFLSMGALFFIKETDEPIRECNVSFYAMMSFFRQQGIGVWVFILAFYFAFILAVWMFIKPYLIMKGLNTDDVAIYVGFYGSTVGFVGGMLASRVGKYLTKKRALIYFALFKMISIIILIVLEQYKFTLSLVLAAITLISFAIAFSSTIIFSLIMDHSRTDSKATDYAVQSSLSAVVRILSTIVAGVLIASFGYNSLFCIALIGTGMVVWVIYRFYNE